MKALPFVLASILVLAASAKHRDWKEGTIVRMGVSDPTVIQGAPVAIANSTPSGRTPAGAAIAAASSQANAVAAIAASRPFVVQWVSITVRSGEDEFVVSRLAGSHNPNVGVGAKVRFALERDRLYLVDSDGREWEMRLGRKDAAADLGGQALGAPIQTHGSLNCRGWRSAADSFKLGFAVGLTDGYGYGAAEGKVANPDLKPIGPTSNGEIVESITAFCGKAENANIRAIYAVQVLGMTLRGETPASIETWTASLRKAENLYISEPVTTSEKVK